MFGKRLVILVCAIVFVLALGQEAGAGDWPMWRFDAGRTAASPHGLPDELELQWVRHYTPRIIVWEEPLNVDRMPYDKFFEPVVLGKTLFLGFNDTDKLLAIDTDTGEDKWAFYCDGPVRLPPVAYHAPDSSRDRVLFVSDDGCLYCLDAATGERVWKFRGGPSDRKVLGNKRLISMWPARGGPVLEDTTVYFAAGIWPFMGVFIYAIDVDTGNIVWRNDSTSAQWINQPHRNPAFAGVAPQGALVASGDRLLVPGGRSVPACFDLHTGEFLYYRLDEDKPNSYGHTGGSFVCAARGVFFNHYMDKMTAVYDLAQGFQLAPRIARYPVLTKDVFYFPGESIAAVDAELFAETPRRLSEGRLWRAEVDASGDLIKAGDRLYAAGDGHITAVQIPRGKREPKAAWTKTIDGKVERLLAADDKLFAVTLDGRIMAFAQKAKETRHFEHKPAKPNHASAEADAKAILDKTEVREGYALFYGVGDGNLLEGLALATDLMIVAVDADAEKVDALRRRFDAQGLYGTRIAVLEGDPFTLEIPPYMASLSVVGDLDAAKYEATEAFLKRIFGPMRPYGGKTWLPLGAPQQDEFLRLVEASALPGAKAAATEGGVLLSREGPLPGSAWWTHQYSNAANTVKSDDVLVKMPLGLLWFGGNSNADVLPRHGHGPSPQIIGGRLFIEGMDLLNARDVYTGRVIWQTRFGDLGTFGAYYDNSYPNQRHIPGANSRGTNFVATLDEVYVIQGGTCHALDSATGAILDTIRLPGEEGGEPPQWGYIGVSGDTLVGGCNFVDFSRLLPEDERKPGDAKYNFDNTASQQIIVMDRHTGVARWAIEARHGFIHNAIAITNDTVFCLDKLPPYIEGVLERRGLRVPGDYRLLALDIHTGETRWEKQEDVFGSWLSYSKEHDVLLEATRPSGDMVHGEEGRRMITYRGEDGKVIWDITRDYFNPPILHGDRIITYTTMYNLLTGEQVVRTNPLTGNPAPWQYQRTKGCGYHIASENLITFRSSAAGYYDLVLDGGIGHFGGFKSGCSANLIAADGVLNAPDYTRTCTCSYQNQTSLALVHMPDIEVWTTCPALEIDGPILRVGINLAAPGDRRTEEGTLWLEHPVVGGASPDIEVTTEPEDPEWFLHHSSYMEGDGPGWVGASGATGLTTMKVTLAPGAINERTYTVRLFFAEPHDLAPGERVFSVRLQGREVLSDFDIVEAARGPRRTVVREFSGIKVKEALEVELVPSRSSPKHKPILCGLDAFAEE